MLGFSKPLFAYSLRTKTTSNGPALRSSSLHNNLGAWGGGVERQAEPGLVGTNPCTYPSGETPHGPWTPGHPGSKFSQDRIQVPS